VIAVRRAKQVAAALGVTAALIAAAGCSGSSPKARVGTIADVGFRPGPNGFAFQNYGNTLSDGSAPTNLTAANVETMFGSGVCASDVYGFCVLNPAAQAWLNSTNAAMADGHCYGFSVAAELLWQQKLNPKKFGAGTTPFLSITDNQALQSQIAYDWSMQTLPSVQSQRISGTPNQILAKLRQVLTAHPSDTYTIAIWKRDGSGGHAITPFAVVNKGSGQFDVLIYDNNFPDVTRTISFNTKADTWSYAASSIPTEPDAIYEGDAVTKTITLFPTSPGLGVQPCPFCGKVPSAGTTGTVGATEQIYLAGGAINRAGLMITDTSGHRLGVVNGSLVNEIPGSEINPVISSSTWTNKITPNYVVPANGTYTLALDGSALTGPDTETVGIIGPSFALSVDNVAMRPGDKDSLTAAPYATKMSYTVSRPKSVTLELGVSDNQADYAFTVSGLSARPGGVVSLTLPAESSNLTVANAGTSGTSKVDVQATRYTAKTTTTFSHQGIPLAGGDTALLQFGHWTATGQGIPLVTSHGGHRSTAILSDQPRATTSAGAAGAAGPTGASGPSGAAGAAGSQGVAGQAGATGASGAAGSAGAAGQSGAQGPAGSTGSPGPAGPAGPAGPVGPPGQPGAAGETHAYQGALVGGSVGVSSENPSDATKVARTPVLPAGQYVVTADLTLAGAASDHGHQNAATTQIDCFVAANSNPTNRDGVLVAADIGPYTQTLSVDDIVSASGPGDQIDLLCYVQPSGSEAARSGTVTHASIVATQVAGATSTTASGRGTAN
jgi:hypothetical protein